MLKKLSEERLNLATLLTKAEIRQLLNHSDMEPTLSELRDAFSATVLPALLQTPVLQKLSNLQRTLDPLDIEGLCALWSQAAATI